MSKPAPRANTRSSPKATAKLETSIRDKTAELVESVRLLNATRPKSAERLIPNENQDLLHLSDALTTVHGLTEAAYMAAHCYPNDETFALATLLDITSTKLKSAIDDLDKITKTRILKKAAAA